MEANKYFDDAETYDWEKGELLDAVSFYDKEHKITCTVTKGGTVYDLEAVGQYSLGELVVVTDITITDACPADREPEDA